MAPNDNSSGSPPAPPTATSAAASGCPVLARGGDASSSTKSGLWGRWFSRSADNATSARAPSIDASSSSTAAAASGCPVKGGGASIPASVEEAARHPQAPAPGQRIPLSTQRVISSIPRGDDDDDTTTQQACDEKPSSVPAHQPAAASRWQYPSEQQFYNAMLRKGHRPPVEVIPDVLRIHNAVNERSWAQVCKWEKELHDNPDPKLVKFVGRPKDLSPRAWFNSRIWMTQEPFDRHDWYVADVEGGEPRRYVIDFYEGKDSSTTTPSTNSRGGDGKENNVAMKPPSMYIDARPALDNPSAAADRMAMFAREALPGLAGAWDSYKASSAAAASGQGASVAQIEGGKGNGEGGK